MKKVFILCLSAVIAACVFCGCNRGVVEGEFYTLKEAYEAGLLTREDLQTIALYYNGGEDVPDPIDARVAASIRESAAQRERLVNHTLEAKARDYEILKFYGEYNGCYAVKFNFPYGQFPAVDVDEWEEIGGIRFHHTTHEPLEIWKSKG